MGNEKFQFDFDYEDDIQKVLSRRPCHFNNWTFALERWEPNIIGTFSNTLTLWVKVEGIPLHYRKVEAFHRVGDVIGEVRKVDVHGLKVLVTINGDCQI